MSIFSDLVSGVVGGASAATPTGAVTAVASTVDTIVKRIWQDPEARDKMLLELRKLEQDGDLARMVSEAGLLTGQMKVNEVEAKSESLFVSGWRPAVGWVCVLGLSWAFFISPIVEHIIYLVAPGTAIPKFEVTELLTLLAGMLGVYGMRSSEKKAGVS